jgi:pSer/pThr/pTyr-binding forkhead associated (FHA) protein
MVDLNEARTVLIEKGEALKDRSYFGWLAIIEGTLRGEAFHLHEGRNRIGSSPPSDIRIPDEGVQDQHMSIRISSHQWMLTDLDSETGTWLNGKRVYRNELKDGDKIKIGKVVLQIKIL